MIESHEKEIAKVSANKEVYTAIANSSWKKEEELRALKGEAAELDRKIALTLSPPEEETEMKEQEYGQITTQEATTQEVKQKPEPTTPQHTPKPKWR